MLRRTTTGMGFWLMGFGVLLAPAGHAAGDKPIPLVKDGLPRCIVVLGSGASVVERHAAEELRTYIRKVSGADVPQVETLGKGVTGVPIVLGTPESTPAVGTAELLPEIQRLSSEGFLIRAGAKGLFIAARKPMGVLYGVYAFLEDNLGIRWFFPGEKGEYCPRMSSIEVGPIDATQNPAFTIRSTNHTCANFNGKFTDTWDWMVRNKMQIRYAPCWKTNRKELQERGATFTGGGHTLNALVPPEKYFQDHPEYYPLIKGKREFYDWRKGGDVRQICTSNPEVIDLCAKGIISSLRDAPPADSEYYSPCDLFALGNNDGNGWCECDRCRALDDPWEQKQGLVTTRFYKFINAVTEKVLKECPDKRMIGWGYQQFQVPPKGVKPDPRLLIMVAMHGRCYQHSYNDPACPANVDKVQLLKGWVALGNDTFVHEYFSCQPAHLPLENIAARDIKHLWGLGVKAWRAEIPPPDGSFGPFWDRWEIKESWIAEFPTYYLVAKLLWDPSLDPQKLKEDLYKKYYGPAAAAMRNYRELLARTWETAPGHFIYGTTLPYVGKCLLQPGREQQLLKCLADAERAAATDAVYRDRVGREKRYFNAIWQRALADWGKMTSVEAAHVKKREGPIVIDGALQEADWEAAPSTTSFINSDTGKPATAQTFVKLLYDNDYLYLGVVAMEPSPDKMTVRSTNRDEPVWKDDDLELFIDPEGSARTYYHFAVNPKGTVYDAKCVPGSFDASWNADCEVACKTLADRWVLEMKIKASSLNARIRDGGIWKLNVARSRRPDGGEGSSWSADGSSHQPASFRPIVFGSKPPLVQNGGFEKATEAEEKVPPQTWQAGSYTEIITRNERPPSLAVVNPPVRSSLAEVLSLRGTWDFAMDPKGRGRDEGWMQPKAPWPGTRAIQVPGCWEAQGVGQPGGSITWDIHFDCLPRPLRHVYRGSAWYRRVVAIPKTWDGKRVWLKVGGLRAQGWFWVNGRPVAHVDDYCGAYKYDVTDLVAPGNEAVVVALVRNDVPARKGSIGASHCFGGLYRDVELEATPATWIDNVWVQGDFDRRAAVVHATIRSLAAAASEPLLVDVRVQMADGRPAGQASRKIGPPGKDAVEAAIEVPLAQFRPWSPETPALYLADVTLRDGDRAVHGWQERFGVRKWEVRGKDFYLNGRKHFVRGYGDDYMYPVTLCSPASREEHRRHLKLAREYGFTYVRHHTHCEIPEFYDAADELGIMIQPELPYYGKLVTEAFPFDPKRDLAELITHYRRYPSLATYCMGNEGHLGSPLDHELYALAKRLDPARLVIHEDGGQNTAENSDFGSGRGAPDWGAYPQESDPRPWCHHEYLNLAVGRDPRTAPKYSGAYQPPSPEALRNRLESLGLDPQWGLACVDAGQQLQRLYQKQGLETARLNPGCHGYIYWTIASVDAWVDQGLLDPFWGVKASKPDFFRQFNGQTAVLADMTSGARILAAGETLKLEWWISHFGQGAIDNGTLHWEMHFDKEALKGAAPVPVANVHAEVGDVKPVGQVLWQAPATDKPARARLAASLAGTDVANSWDLWVFPKLSPKPGAGAGLCAAPPVHRVLAPRYPGMTLFGAAASQQAQILLTTTLDDSALDWLRQGKDVLLLRLVGPASGVKLGWWGLGNQSGTAIAKHPAFGNFPHDGYLNELWFRILDAAVPAGMPGLKSVEPLMVGDGQLGYLIHVFQAKAGKGKLLASGLDLLGDKPEAVCLLDQFIQYVQSNRFQPSGTLDLRQAASEWEAWTALTSAVNGWAATTQTFRRVTYPSFWGERPMCVARQSGSEKLLAWNTRPVPADLDPAKRYTFRWFAALGWHTQPPGKFTLALGEQPLVDFDVVDRTTTWTNTDGTIALKYTLRGSSGLDNSGVMELTLPAKLLTPGRPAELRVVPAQTGSRRWFGLYEWP